MENGKGAFATNLISDVGFGSTEFHVLRAKSAKSSRFVYYWSINPILRLAAKNQMVGSAGQQRVPTLFFEKYPIGLPPLSEQEQIGELLTQADKTVDHHKNALTKLNRLKAGLMHDLLTPPSPATETVVAEEAETLSA